MIENYDAQASASTSPDLSGSLVNKGEPQLNKLASQPPKGYYVIVGHGPAAIINHTTLRQSKWGRDRLKREGAELPVVHVGHEDPWLHYFKHGMGQPPYLLRMPGYHKPIAKDPEVIDRRLSSAVFAQSTKAEWQALQDLTKPPFKKQIYFFEAWIAGIESEQKRLSSTDLQKSLETLADEADGTPSLNKGTLQEAFKADYPKNYPPYRLLAIDPTAKLWWIYAYRIDLCTGSGVNNVEPRTPPKPKLFKQARKAPWIPFGLYKASKLDLSPIVHGRDGLVSDTQWPAKTRVCVYGSGGIALNQVERCKVGEVEKTCLLDWVAPKTFQNNFVLPTNDPVLRPQPPDWKGAEDSFMKAGGADVLRGKEANKIAQFAYVPGSLRWRFAIWTNFKEGKIDSQRVKAEFEESKESDKTKATMWDAFPQMDKDQVKAYPVALELKNGCYSFSDAYATRHSQTLGQTAADIYDRVIVCIGVAATLAGEPSQTAQAFSFDRILFKGRRVGLNTTGEQGGDIRILGAAALMFPADKLKQDKNVEDETKAYYDSLPVSAVPDGFIRAGCSIAAANGYFDDEGRHNANINTASLQELKDALTKAGVKSDSADRLAKLAVEKRKAPANGVDSLDQTGAVQDYSKSQQAWVQKGAPSQPGAVDPAMDMLQLTSFLSLDYPPAVPWEKCYPEAK